MISELLRRQNTVHLRLGQAQTLRSVCSHALRQRAWYRHVLQSTNQSHLETFQEETVTQERRL